MLMKVGADLFEKGVIFSNGLNGPKARLKLLVGLSQNMNHQKLKIILKNNL